MPNDRLRTAIRAAGLTIEDVCSRVAVDPKTVERWISNESRKPHRRTRLAVAALLGVDEVHLWPEVAADIRTRHTEQSEVVHVYPTRASVPHDVWLELISDASSEVDILVYAGAFLVEQYNLLPVIRRKSAEGAKFRLLVGDHTSTAVIQRAREEGTPGGLEGRTQLMLRYLESIARLPGVEVRSHGTVLYNSIYRFDDDMLINGHAYGTVAGQNPVIHIRRVHSGMMWENYSSSFERVWASGVPELQ